MDQTRFGTRQDALETARELYLADNQRQVEGHSFVMTLMVDIPYRVEAAPLDIIVDRIATDYEPYRLANKDPVVETVARLTPSGKPFAISILLETSGLETRTVTVFVSTDMEIFILEQFDREIDDGLDFILKGG